MPRSLLSFTPFGSKDSNVYQLITANELEHNDRLRRYREAWRFYKGDHWSWSRDQNEPFVTINYCQAFVDVLVNFLFKSGFKVQIPDDPATEENEQQQKEFVRLMLQETWRCNKEELLAFEMGQMGSVTGDVFLRVSWEDKDPLEKSYARVDVLPSQYVFPKFGGPYGVDRKVVENVLVLFPKYKAGEAPNPFFDDMRGKRGMQDVEFYAERWWPDKVEVWDPVSEAPAEVRPNPLGEIPIVHIPNYPIAGEYYGRSDLADIMDLQREYNEKATDISDVINYHGSPVTIVTGAKLTTLERGANRMWGLPEGANVSNLALSGELNASLDYLDRIKTAMHEIGGIPEGILGNSVGNPSGVAVAMRYLPLVEKRNVKIQTYGYGLRLCNRLIMKLTALMDDEFGKEFNKLDDMNKYQNDIKFPDPLPRDESIELDKAQKRLELGLSTRKMELERLGYSQAEITRIMDDFDAEKMRDAEQEFEIGMKFAPEPMEEEAGDGEGGQSPDNPGNPDPEQPNPEVQSEKKSISATPETK